MPRSAACVDARSYEGKQSKPKGKGGLRYSCETERKADIDGTKQDGEEEGEKGNIRQIARIWKMSRMQWTTCGQLQIDEAE